MTAYNRSGLYEWHTLFTEITTGPQKPKLAHITGQLPKIPPPTSPSPPTPLLPVKY